MWPVTIATECLIVHKYFYFEFIKHNKTCLVEITLVLGKKQPANEIFFLFFGPPRPPSWTPS